MPDVEQFSAEEQAAMEAMQADNEPVTEEEQEAARPAPEPDPEPAPPAPTEPVADPTKPPEGFVPHQAMHKEREARRVAEAELVKLREQLAAAQPKPAEPEIPDPILDPNGFREYQRKSEQRWQEFEQRQQQARQEEQLIGTVQQREAEFVKANPDYEAAVTHLRNARVEELRLYGATDDQIGQQIAQETRQLVMSAMQQGRNPAEVAYQAAKMRGYAAAPVASAAPAADPAQMQALSKAQANSGTLSTAGGPAVVGDYTVEMLANMSEAEYAKLPKDVISRVMGG